MVEQFEKLERAEQLKTVEYTKAYYEHNIKADPAKFAKIYLEYIIKNNLNSIRYPFDREYLKWVRTQPWTPSFIKNNDDWNPRYKINKNGNDMNARYWILSNAEDENQAVELIGVLDGALYSCKCDKKMVTQLSKLTSSVGYRDEEKGGSGVYNIQRDFRKLKKGWIQCDVNAKKKNYDTSIKEKFGSNDLKFEEIMYKLNKAKVRSEIKAIGKSIKKIRVETKFRSNSEILGRLFIYRQIYALIVGEVGFIPFVQKYEDIYEEYERILIIGNNLISIWTDTTFFDANYYSRIEEESPLKGAYEQKRATTDSALTENKFDTKSAELGKKKDVATPRTSKKKVLGDRTNKKPE
jgi:hypothetical protein